MAKKYDIHAIGDIKYELHPVKVGSRRIGFVPVRCLSSMDDIQKQIDDSEVSEAQVAADYKYGLAVRLQREARSLLTGDKFNEAAYQSELNLLTADELSQFAGKANVLREELKRRWLQRQSKARKDADDEQIFTDLIGK